MRIDLHIHSNFSDSSRSPEEIVQIAKQREVGILSVCDHYTIGAYDQLEPLCHKANIGLAIGVELDINWENDNYHVLAYNFDRNNSKMKNLIVSQLDKSQGECEDLIVNMSKDYPQLSLEDYKSYIYPREKGGWKYIHYIAARGVAETYQEASNFFGRYFVPRPQNLEMPEFCSIVKQAGGKPVLAHPGYIYEDSPSDFISTLKRMVESGICGVECYYPSHYRETTDICVDFCRKNNLRITGGCDCHGSFDTSEGFTIGALNITADMLDLRGIL